MDVQKQLSEYILERGIKISFISRKTNIPYELLRRAISGERKLIANELVLILQALDLELKELISK